MLMLDNILKNEIADRGALDTEGREESVWRQSASPCNLQQRSQHGQISDR